MTTFLRSWCVQSNTFLRPLLKLLVEFDLRKASGRLFHNLGEHKLKFSPIDHHSE